MPEASIAANIYQALDVHLHLATQIALDRKVLRDVIANRADLAFGQISNARARVHAGELQRLLSGRSSDTVNVLQADDGPFVAR
jgi:hypothetical protein